MSFTFSNIDSYNDDFKYVQGFGAHISSEALEGALPVGQNVPQKCPYGLYAEQLSGTAFTLPRHQNQRTWMYRIRPSVVHEPFEPYRNEKEIRQVVAEFSSEFATPQQLRWLPSELPSENVKVDFVDGLVTMAGAGNAGMKSGFAVHMYHINASMENRAFCTADGDLLIGRKNISFLLTNNSSTKRSLAHTNRIRMDFS
jgi:homogentisate 1,2-dioxygenase